jgi:hypothetical protein
MQRPRIRGCAMDKDDEAADLSWWLKNLDALRLTHRKSTGRSSVPDQAGSRKRIEALMNDNLFAQ